MLKPDSWIKSVCKEPNSFAMICPFIPTQQRKRTGAPSYGLTSAGYDIRLNPTQILIEKNGRKVQWQSTEHGEVKTISGNILTQIYHKLKMYFSPKPFYHGMPEDEILKRYHVIENWSSIDLPPHTFALAVSLEHFNIPEKIFGICVGKSTIARAGQHITVTPLENGWQGFLTLEWFNQTSQPYKIETDVGVTQVMFQEITEGCETSYSGRDGKYMGQPPVPVVPR